MFVKVRGQSVESHQVGSGMDTPSMEAGTLAAISPSLAHFPWNKVWLHGLRNPNCTYAQLRLLWVEFQINDE